MRAAAARRVFGALYGSLAPAYDIVSRCFFAGQWAVWQRSALNHVAGADLFEIGYGTGDLLVEMARRGFVPRGIDASPRMRSLALRKLLRAGYPDVELECGRASALPFPNGSFDSLVSTFPTEYIFEPATWSEARRVLRPGGRYVLVLSGELLPVDRRSRLLRAFHALVYGKGAQTVPTDRFPARGFELRLVEHSNARGRAHILVATVVDGAGVPTG